MKEFYQSIVRRWLAADKWGAVEMTPLESMVYQECRQAEDAQRIHEHQFDLMLQDIAQREEEAAKWGDGEEDYLIALFHSLLRRGWRIGRAEDVYPLRRQGLSTDETAAELGIAAEEVEKAEQKLLRLYSRACRRAGEQPNISVRSPRYQTVKALAEGEYRLFRQTVTGEVHYRLYRRDRLLGYVTTRMGRDFPATLQLGTLRLDSSFDADQTIVPGVYRSVVDADNLTAEYARLTYLGENGYTLCLNWDTGKQELHIKPQEGGYSFYLNGELCAQTYALEEPQEMLGWDLRYCMRVFRPISEDLAMMLLSFPLLTFTW